MVRPYANTGVPRFHFSIPNHTLPMWRHYRKERALAVRICLEGETWHNFTPGSMVFLPVSRRFFRADFTEGAMFDVQNIVCFLISIWLCMMCYK